MSDVSDIPGVIGMHHVALAVADLDLALVHWVGALGARLELRAVVESQGVEAASLEWPRGSLLELVAPAPGPLGEGSGIARFLERRGAGLHHVAWEVRSVAAALAALHTRGVRVIDDEPRPGLHGTPVAFLHPSSMDGVLVELVEVAEGVASQRGAHGFGTIVEG